MGTDTEPAMGAELAEAARALPALQRRPIIDTVPQQMLALLRSRTTASGKAPPTDGEMAAFLELCAAYQLDPFAGEVWLAKGSEDRVLIMVGRDGLRRIAKRNGIRVYCDVIHEKDEFNVAFARGEHAVTHTYSHPNARGPIAGAWAVAVDEGGRELGFYIATVGEFKPTNERQLRYSPWGAQESVMILAAAERQALRQATPLSGLVAQGELDRGEEMAEGLPSREEEDERLNAVATQFPPGVCSRILGIIDRAREQGHAGIADVAALEMALLNQDTETAVAWCDEHLAELDRHAETLAPPEVETVEPEPRCGEPDPDRKGTACVLVAGHEGPHYAAEQTWDRFDADPQTWPSWWCHECGQRNSGWARSCGRCDVKRPNPSGPAPADWQQPIPPASADAAHAQVLRDEANALLDQAQGLREAATMTTADDEEVTNHSATIDALEAEAEAKHAEAERLAPEQPELS